MPNALTPPPTPNPDSRPEQSSNNALMASPPAMPAGGQPTQQQIPPPPTHQQVVAGLRYCDAVEEQLTALAKDPDFGKADLKKKCIDGETKLVANGILTASQAVGRLATFPDNPFEQKQWVMKQLSDTAFSARILLAHHRQGFAGQPPQPTPKADNHIADIASLINTHGGSRGG
jgi:hypothetical protein